MFPTFLVHLCVVVLAIAKGYPVSEDMIMEHSISKLKPMHTLSLL